MKTLEAISISNAIGNSIEAENQQLIEEFTKMGFVNIDGVIHQYQPMTYKFVPLNNDTVNRYIDKNIKNNWATNRVNHIKNLMLESLPLLNEIEVNKFKHYIDQYQVKIDDAEIEKLLNAAIEENKTLQNKNADFKGQKGLIGQLIILRNENIFATNRNMLFQYKNGEFERFTSNSVMGLLNDKIAVDDVKLSFQEVKNNWNDYTKSLVDITHLLKLIRQKEKRESVQKDCEADYKKILQLIKGYSY